jgi:DNA-binding NarL/FixJ family response regulator
VRIVLADDEQRVRSALRLLLQELTKDVSGARQERPFVIVEAAGAEAVVRELREEVVDLLLLDWELPGMAAGELISKVRGLSPDCVVIAMSGRPEAARDAAGRGVDAFISKNEPPDKLVSTVLRRVRGNGDVKMPRSVRGGGLSSR